MRGRSMCSLSKVRPILSQMLFEGDIDGRTDRQTEEQTNEGTNGLTGTVHGHSREPEKRENVPL